MATHRFSVMNDVQLDTGVFIDQVGNQITAATAPSVGNQICYVMADGGSDEGIYFKFAIPTSYVGSAVFVVKGILDGAPGAGDDLAFGLRKRAVADNESADGTFDAEQTAQNTDISGWANEDSYEETITLTDAHYTADDEVYGYLFIDASGTTYTGNFLLTDLLFQFSDT